MPIKVAIIGAGSIGFSRRLFRDILAVPELRDTHFALTDINRENLSRVAQLCRKDIKANRLEAKITATPNRRRALEEANYVINCVRIGGLEAFRHDIEIPLKYGVDQCVGDTLCVGGIMYGQRNIPCIEQFCRDIKDVAAPDALLLNYANPNAMNTWAALDADVRTVGLCHGVMGGHHQIAEALALLNGDIDKPLTDGNERLAFVEQTDIICAGINHQTWYTRILYKGRLIDGEELLAAFENHPTYSRTEKIRIDVLRRIGYYSTESNGHLSEYLPWYRTRRREIGKWISRDVWIHGQTGGYLKVCTANRNEFDKHFDQWLAREDKPIGPEDRSHEHGSHIIEALETGRCYRGHFNVRNNGVIANLPDDCIVEVPGYVDRNGMSIPRVGELPLACAASLSASVNVQRMAVRAAQSGDVALLKQAVLHDPLTGAVCEPPQVWDMVDEMLVAQAPWLPQYNAAIKAAESRLAATSPRKARKARKRKK